MGPRIYCVYIMASLSKALYTGFTSELEQRVWQHKEGIFGGHTSKYKKNRLVFVEGYGNPKDAIAREKEIKEWKRYKKIELIEKHNPEWADLSENWGQDATSPH